MYIFHIGAVLFSFGVLLVADSFAFSWFSGKRQTLSARPLHILHVLMWVGLGATILFGILMAYPMLPYLLGRPTFIAKMLFVGILVTNAFLIGSLMGVATKRPFASLSFAQRVPLFVSGAISTLSWVSAALLGLGLF